MVSIKVSRLLAEWGHSVWRSFLKALWKAPPTHQPPPPPSQPSQAITTVCVFVRVCVSDWVQALLGFSGVWTAGRVVLIGQNDAEMDRKPLWSSWGSFSPSLTFTLSLRFNHSLIHPLLPLSPSSFRSPLHRHRSALFSALAVTRLRCCSTNFSHPFIPAIRPFPKSTLSQRGEAFSHWLLLHGNFSLFCSSFRFLSQVFLSVFPFKFCLSLDVLFPLTASVSVLFTLSVLGQFFYLAVLSVYPFKTNMNKIDIIACLSSIYLFIHIVHKTLSLLFATFCVKHGGQYVAPATEPFGNNG